MSWAMARRQPQAELLLKGARVVLRAKRPEDAWQDYLWRTDPELSRLDAAYPMTTSFGDFRAYYREEMRYPPPRSYRYAIETVQGLHVGNCMYYDLNSRKGETELGILIGDRDYWGQGYGSEAVTLLVCHIFGELGLKRIYLKTLDWNIRAQRSFEKCGFLTYSRSSRPPWDFVLMELLREWWEARDPTCAATRG